jgi:putative ABC transport system permease protein
MHPLRQILALTASAIRSIPARLGASLVTVIGVTTVMAVLVALLSLGEGVTYLAGKNVRADRAVVLSKGASASNSFLTRANIAIIADAPGVKKDDHGKPLLTAGTLVQVDLITNDSQRGNVFLIGFTNPAVYSEIRVVEGRYYRPGLHELIVSESVRSRYRDTGIGGHIQLHGEPWTIVGVFKDTGGFFDLNVFADGDTVLSAFGRNAFQQVVVQLDSAAAFDAFRHAVTTDPSLTVDVQTEAQNRLDTVKQLKGLLDFISYFVGGLMAIGALCGALSSLYAAVDARRREIATLRAIGFSSGPVVVSVLVEGIVLALPAAVLGAAIAWLMFNGNVISTVGLTFPLAVTPHLALISLFWAVGIALLGGLLPALRAADLPVATALRAT